MVNTSTYKPATAYDIEIMSRTVYGEARGEVLAGQFGVAYVILHRAALAAAFVQAHGRSHPIYGNGSIAGACRAPWQFSCWNLGDPNREKLCAVSMEDADFQHAQYVALAAIHRQVNDALPESTHYFNPSIVNPPPSWVNGVPAHDGKPAIQPAVQLGSLGNQCFYKVVG